MTHLHLEEIDSTNAYLKREYQNFDNLSFVSASYQTSGKGRENRVWKSNKNENALFSYIVKDKKLISSYSCLSIYTAMLVADFIEKIGIKNVTIKWPNDVYVNGKKICGILLEGNVPNYVIVGVGLNVLQKEFPSDLRHPATSLFLEKNDVKNVKEILDILINKIYAFWLNFSTKKLEYENYLNSHNYLENKNVKIIQENEEIFGIVKGIDSDNNLLLENANKNILKIDSGEIEIL